MDGRKQLNTMQAKKLIHFVFTLLLISSQLLFCATAQFSRHIVWLKNKGNNSFTLSDPSPYLSARAITRRT
ncbi:MAG: hypothetical protein RIS12_506, partial [Bacteroidota bacterium]